MVECAYVMGVYRICIDDYVTVHVGRKTYKGVVKGLSTYAILVANDNHPVLIKLSKVSAIEVHRDFEPRNKDPLAMGEGSAK